MKRKYIKPTTKIHRFKVDNIMFTASPGVGEDWNGSMPLEVKNANLEIEDDEEWEE